MASNEQEEMFLTCKACDIRFRSIKTYKQHVKGKKHTKQVEDQKKEKQVKLVDEDSSNDEAEDSKAQEFTCDLCEIVFTGIVPYTQHLKSKHHAKIIRKKEAEDESAVLENAGSDSELLDDDADLNEMAKKILPEPYGSCSICEKQFSGPESYSEHMKSKSHAKRKYELQLLKKIRAVLIDEGSDSEEDTKEEKGLQELKCKDCDKIFSNSVSFAQHLISRAHRKRENQNKLLEDLKAINMMKFEDDFSSSEDEESPEILTCDICNLAFSGPESLQAHINSKKHKRVVKWKKYLAKMDKSLQEGSTAQTNLKDKDEIEKPSAEKEIDCSATQD